MYYIPYDTSILYVLPQLLITSKQMHEVDTELSFYIEEDSDYSYSMVLITQGWELYGISVTLYFANNWL